MIVFQLKFTELNNEAKIKIGGIFVNLTVKTPYLLHNLILECGKNNNKTCGKKRKTVFI